MFLTNILISKGLSIFLRGANPYIPNCLKSVLLLWHKYTIEYVNFILSNLLAQMLPYTEIYFLNYFAHENFGNAQNGPICQDPKVQG